MIPDILSLGASFLGHYHRDVGAAVVRYIMESG